MKTAQQKLNDSFDENATIRATVRAFVDDSYNHHQSYAHAAGYLQSFAAELIMQLPKAKRDQFMTQLLRSTVHVTC